MLENLYFWAIQAQMEQGWFSRNWSDLAAAASDKQFWQILINPYGIAVAVILLIIAAVTRSKGPLMMVIAFYGYAGSYHYTIAVKQAGDVHFDLNAMKMVEIGPLVTFFVAVMIVTAVLLYLGFIKQ